MTAEIAAVDPISASFSSLSLSSVPSSFSVERVSSESIVYSPRRRAATELGISYAETREAVALTRKFCFVSAEFCECTDIGWKGEVRHNAIDSCRDSKQDENPSPAGQIPSTIHSKYAREDEAYERQEM